MSLEPRAPKALGQPTTIALMFCSWAVLVPTVFGGRLLNGDGDLARHLVLGRHILEHGVVFPDVFSHTLPGQPFIAYEWLSEVILALTERMGGLAAVAALSGLLIAVSIALVVYYLRTQLEPALTVPLGVLAAVFTGPHWIARPHLFSFVCLAALLVIVTHPAGWKRHLGLGLLFVFWSNLHPGFFYGLAILGAYLVGDTLDHRTRTRLAGNALSGLAAGLGTLVNPLTWHLHREILRHLAESGAMGLVDEFASPSLRSGYSLLFIFVVLVVIALLIARHRWPPYSALLPFLAAVVASVEAQRNITLFGLFALPLIMTVAADPIRGWNWAPLADTRRRLMEDDARGTTVPWIAGAVAAVTLLAAGSGRLGPLQLIPDSFSTEAFPVEAVGHAREAHLNDYHILNEYGWGGYILWAWPEQKIYIDGMANFFGASIMAEYMDVMLLRPGWQDILRRRDIDLMILRPTAPLVGALGQSDEWETWYQDETAVVLLKRSATHPGS